jgi:hypothetical protein
MSNPDPTGRGYAVALSIPADHVVFLRQTFDACLDGLYGDLAMAGAELRDPARTWSEARAFERLRAGLDAGEIAPDDDVIRVVVTLAKQADVSSDFEQVVLEHRAFCGLLSRLTVGGER